jgi:polyisoprenoid-binding protein YceI
MCSKAIWILGLFVALTVVGRCEAESLVFDYKDPKEISSVSLTLDSPLEPIFGYAKGISGTVRFDPAHPKAATGSISVAVDSVQFANEGYTATARGFALEGQKYPAIRFILKKVLTLTTPAPNVYEGMVQADFVCKGITLPMTVPVKASFFPGKAAERTNGQFEGDVLVLRTHFSVSRTKLGISAGIPANMVADAVEVRVSCVGIHYAPKPVKTALSQTWKIEVELRDDPVKVDAVFDLDSLPPKASFQTAAGRLEADQVHRKGKTLLFHLPNNPQTGARKGEAVFEGETVQGRLVGKEDTLTFHGRPKRASDDTVSFAPPGQAQGPGFRDLRISADGKEWTVADRMK